MSTATATELLEPSSCATGPRTAAGKAVVSRNGLRHGLSAKKALLKGEEAEFAELMERLISELEPVGIVEELLVQRVAHCFLRCQRADLFVKGSLEGEDVNEVGVGRAFYRDGCKSDNLMKALRHLASAERSALTLLHELGRLKLQRTTGQPVVVPALDVIVAAPGSSEPYEGT